MQPLASTFPETTAVADIGPGLVPLSLEQLRIATSAINTMRTTDDNLAIRASLVQPNHFGIPYNANIDFSIDAYNEKYRAEVLDLSLISGTFRIAIRLMRS
jgi:hypothetical protein